ncbi:MAG: hypothetical protein FJ035_03955 [Chloroflexi bacterium]|nr:hypothetical protein [Chloroflexota bacterium]
MTSEAEVLSAWATEELARASARLDALAREVVQLQAVVLEQREQAEALRQALATVEGRTRRQEGGRDAALGLGLQLAAFDERLYEEAALRRDQAVSLEHQQRALGEQLQQLERVGEVFDERLRAMELAVVAVAERQQQLAAEVSGRRERDRQLGDRQEALAERIGAVATLAQRAADDVVPYAVALPRVELVLRTLDARTSDQSRAQERANEELRVVRGLADREVVFVELFDQLRALRLQLEERLRTFEERSELLERTTAGSVDQRVLLGEHVRTLEVRIEQLTRNGELQRQALLDHFRRMSEAAEEANRRAAEELARQARADRELLVRMVEGSEVVATEQPL